MAKILVVDDSESARIELCEILKEQKHETLEAANGAIALEMYEKAKDIELIVTDYNMPVMDGLVMCEELKANHESKGPPVIMVTTESDPRMKARGKQAGVVVWIIKPFNDEAFSNVVAQVLDRFPK